MFDVFRRHRTLRAVSQGHWQKTYQEEVWALVPNSHCSKETFCNPTPMSETISQPQTKGMGKPRNCSSHKTLWNRKICCLLSWKTCGNQFELPWSFLLVVILTKNTTYGDIYSLKFLEAGFLNRLLNISMKQFKCRAYLGSHSLPIIQDFFSAWKWLIHTFLCLKSGNHTTATKGKRTTSKNRNEIHSDYNTKTFKLQVQQIDVF